MSRFEHIRLHSHKGLREADLLDLGKINVICGPNNSGKTTVLECLANQHRSILGVRLSEDGVNTIAEDGLVGNVGWGRNNPQMDGHYRAAVTKALRQRAMWFAGEEQVLIDTVAWGFAGTWANPHGALVTSFNRAFPKRPSTALIPAKRRLETVKEINAHEEVRPDGRGILNFLFAAKNSEGSLPQRKQFDVISDAFDKVSGGFQFDTFIQQERTPNSSATFVELRFRRGTDEWLRADDCGLGLQELLIILYYAFAAEHDVILIEEPENHLHPEIQRRLIVHLRENAEKQFFIATHSSIFLNTQFADRVFTSRMTDSVQVTNATSRAEVLTELGYSIADNLVSDLVVLCEGPTDKPVLEEFFHKMEIAHRENIKIWPLGGDIMDQLELTVFKESHQIIALIDGDPGSSAIRNRFRQKCKELGIPITRLERYSMENYFSVRAITSVMKGQMPPGVTALEPNRPVSEQLGFEVKKNGGRIARQMTPDEIRGTDLETFLQKVATLVAQNGKALS